MRKQPTTYLGSKELHRRHSVMVEPGNIPRARVMDQHIIDRFLMLGLLSLAQHRAGEYLLKQAADAGMWATGVDLSKTRVTGGKANNVPFRIFPYGRTIALVRRRFGDFHVYVVEEVVCHDWDVSGDEYRMKCLREGLDWISERRMMVEPLQKLRRAMKKGTSLKPVPVMY